MPFLNRTIDNNPNLIRAAVSLHQGGKIPANTFLLDLDTFDANVQLIKTEAQRCGLSIYFMSKQHGRNPIIFANATRDGLAKTVAVDMQCARALHYNGIPLGHIGNLCQVPNAELPTVIGRMQPEVMSVFTAAKAQATSEAATASGRTQDLLLRVRREGDVVFPGADGGILLHELDDAVRAIRRMPDVRIVGVTTFPAISYTNADIPEVTSNLKTLLSAAERLEASGIEVLQINAPGNTSFIVLQILAQHGATHVEPGAALSGHATFNLRGSSPEQPAAVYVTEIAHFVDRQAWIFGGGFFFRDPPVPELKSFSGHRQALVGRDPELVLDRRVLFKGTGSADRVTLDNIDYHGILEIDESSASVGDTVVFGFGTQAFATRAYIGVVQGCSSENPRLLGLFDTQGHRLDKSKWW